MTIISVESISQGVTQVVRQNNASLETKEQSLLRHQVLTKAVVNAADYMGLSQALLGKTLGLSEASISRMKSGDYQLKEGTKEWELAALFVRLYRSLDAIVAGDENALRAWLRSYNQALSESPINLISKISGLAKTVDYVDAYRARV